MGFESLLGNQRLKDNLSASLSRGRHSHFYLISGPEGSGKHTLARLIAAALVCTGSDKPCCRCGPCRKVLANTHPDFITVDDPEKKTVPVDLIRSARADVFIQPNEADRKVYLFPRGQDMGIPGQNALLKVLEEPPAYAVFLLLTDNPEKLLPTIRSRATELQLQALPQNLLLQTLSLRFPQTDRESLEAAAERSGGYLGQAVTLLEKGQAQDPHTQAFAKAFGQRNTWELIQLLVPMEKWKRDALIPTLEQWTELLQNALLCRSGGSTPSETARQIGAARRSADLMAAIGHLRKAGEYAQGNVSPAAICGWLSWVLR